MSNENKTYWIVRINDNDVANVSVASKEEVELIEEEAEPWQISPTQENTRDDMVEKVEEHGYEFDPWS